MKVLCTLIAAALTVLVPAPVSVAEPIVADLYSKANVVRVSGDRAYVAVSAGLQIYDLSSGTPQKLSELFLDRSGAFELAVSGNYVFVLSGVIALEKTYLRVVDVSDPRAPVVVAEYADFPPPSRTQVLHFVGTTLAVAIGNVVELFDASDPLALTHVGGIPIAEESAQVVGIASTGTTLFAAWQGSDGEQPLGGFIAIDVSEPRAPVTLDVVASLGTTPHAIAASEDAVYLGVNPPSVLVYDASDPASLTETARLDFDFTPFASVHADGNRLFVGTQVSDTAEIAIGVYDITVATAPQLLGETNVVCNFAGIAFDAARSSVIVPTATIQGAGLTALRLADDGKLVPTWNEVAPEINDVEVSGATTFLATSEGLWAVRPGANGRVELLGKLALAQPSLRLRIVGSRAYVLGAANFFGEGSRIDIVDVSNVAEMRLLGSLAFEELGGLVTSSKFDVVGETLYLAGRTGLEIYDVSDASAITLLGTHETPSFADNVVVGNGVAYVTTARYEDVYRKVDLYVVKVRNPAKPKQTHVVRDLDSANSTSDLGLHDGRLVVALAGPGLGFLHAGDGKIAVLKINKAKRPKVLARFPTSREFDGYARKLVASGGRLYVADGLAGVSILSISKKGTPEYVGQIDTPGFASGIWVDAAGNVAVADQWSFQLYPAMIQ